MCSIENVHVGCHEAQILHVHPTLVDGDWIQILNHWRILDNFLEPEMTFESVVCSTTSSGVSQDGVGGHEELWKLSGSRVSKMECKVIDVQPMTRESCKASERKRMMMRSMVVT